MTGKRQELTRRDYYDKDYQETLEIGFFAISIEIKLAIRHGFILDITHYGEEMGVGYLTN
jgi:hypothetical protein